MLTPLTAMLQPSQLLPQPNYADNLSIWQHLSGALHQSCYRVLALLIAVLPGILAFFIALLVFALIGMALSALLRRGLTLARFDERLALDHGNAEWTSSTSPTTLVARVSLWACILLGLIIGVAAFDTSYATGTTLSMSLLPYLGRAVGAIFLFFAGTLIARFLGRSVLIGAVNMQMQYGRALSVGVKWLVLVLTAAMVLDHLQVGGSIVDLAFGILFGGIVLTLALAVGLGSQHLVSRSLESHVEHNAEPNPEHPAEHSALPGSAPAPTSEVPIRHF